MTDPQTFITHMTNTVYLSALTQVLHSTAYEEAQNEKVRPLSQAMGSFTSADAKEDWELTREGVASAVREIQAQAYEQAVDTAYEHYLIEEQRDHLHTLNPYKENN